MEIRKAYIMPSDVDASTVHGKLCHELHFYSVSYLEHAVYRKPGVFLRDSVILQKRGVGQSAYDWIVNKPCLVAYVTIDDVLNDTLYGTEILGHLKHTGFYSLKYTRAPGTFPIDTSRVDSYKSRLWELETNHNLYVHYRGKSVTYESIKDRPFALITDEDKSPDIINGCMRHNIFYSASYMLHRMSDHAREDLQSGLGFMKVVSRNELYQAYNTVDCILGSVFTTPRRIQAKPDKSSKDQPAIKDINKVTEVMQYNPETMSFEKVHGVIRQLLLNYNVRKHLNVWCETSDINARSVYVSLENNPPEPIGEDSYISDEDIVSFMAKALLDTKLHA